MGGIARLPPAMPVRRSTPADGPALHALWRGAVRDSHGFWSDAALDDIDGGLGDYVREEPLWVALGEHDEPVGFLGLTRAHVDALFVARASHGRGIGRTLMAHARALAGPLTVNVSEQNAGARAFYAKLGFAVAGRSPTDGEGRPYPVLHLAEG